MRLELTQNMLGFNKASSSKGKILCEKKIKHKPHSIFDKVKYVFAELDLLI
jgi:hypothetical protein